MTTAYDPHTPTHEPGTPDFLLEVAQRIAARIVRSAEPHEQGLVWTVMSPDRERPEARVAVPAQSGGGIYEGTAGIALFLGELYGATGDESLLETVDGALRFSLDEGRRTPETSFGLHGGRAGIAYAAARLGVLCGRPEWIEEGMALLRPMLGKEQGDRAMDVIGGGGGSIPALLRMREWVTREEDRELLMAMARALGDNLMAIADHEAEGWSWGTIRSASIRNLCGYAHGSAGIAHAFLELYHVTGDGAYLYAAEQAMLYERRFFDPDAGNWPDLRHGELGEYTYSGRMDELKARIRGGDEMEPAGPRFMSAWCHGAPGIGLSRLRAWAILGDPVYRDEAEAAIRNTRDSLRAELRGNYSLCHGMGGNAETLLVGAEALGEPALRDEAVEVAVRGWREYEANGRPWPCGTMGGVADPGLLLGDAGIGYFLLRLARPQTPSVLLLTAPDPTERRVELEGYARWQRRVAEEHFGRTLAAFAALGMEGDALVPVRPAGPAPERSDAEAAYDAIVARVEGERDPARRALLEDAFRLERERWELARSVTDFSREFVEALARPAEDEVRWKDARVGLTPRVRVVHSQHDWDAWLEGAGAGPARPPEEEDVFHLLLATNNRVSARPLQPFPAVVLSGVEEPGTLDELVARVEEAVSGAGADRGWLGEQVTRQLQQAYRAGLVTAEPVAAGAAKPRGARGCRIN